MGLLAHQRELIPGAAVVFDVGMHHGATTIEYLLAYPSAAVHGFEPEAVNFSKAREALAAFGTRVKLINAAVSDSRGRELLNVNTHDGTHSLLAIGDLRFFESHVETATRQEVPSIALDDYCAEHELERIDILKMDIQGGELKALKGARRLLSRQAIGLIATEVEFKPLYLDQPLFWDINAHLRSYGYAFYGLYDQRHINGALSWADAIFVAK
jgi:FkbM family methyltransferase